MILEIVTQPLSPKFRCMIFGHRWVWKPVDDLTILTNYYECPRCFARKALQISGPYQVIKWGWLAYEDIKNA